MHCVPSLVVVGITIKQLEINVYVHITNNNLSLIVINNTIKQLVINVSLIPLYYLKLFVVYKHEIL